MINPFGHYEIIAREAYPYVTVPALAGLLFWWYGATWPSIFFLAAAVSVALFFRNPHRVSPPDDGSVLSPADGVVDDISTHVTSPDIESDSLLRICIFMSVFNVHVNRAPASGEVVKVRYRPGDFLDAREPEAWSANEQNALVIHGESCDIGVIQVAGKVARRISCWVRQGDSIRRGDRFGLIHFGSKLVVYCPNDFTAVVREGDRVKAGVSVIARPPG